jgi:hypothetical protein
MISAIKKSCPRITRMIANEKNRTEGREGRKEEINTSATRERVSLI